MYLLLGNLHLESRHYEGAIRSFERAQAKMRHCTSQALVMVSLVGLPMAILHINITYDLWQVTGWKFDNLDIIIRQRLCEALYASGHAKRAGESLLEMTRLFNQEIYSSRDITRWISGAC